MCEKGQLFICMCLQCVRYVFIIGFCCCFVNFIQCRKKNGIVSKIYLHNFDDIDTCFCNRMLTEEKGSRASASDALAIVPRASAAGDRASDAAL